MSKPAVMNRFRRLFEVFEEADKRLLLVGGCVRDLLMENTPKDYDFATDALPTETRRILRTAGMKAIPLGEEFGTIATVVDEHQYEITTFRVKESYTKGSRHPVVKFGHDIEEDLGRRDLTINAMAMDHEGNVIDPFGGRQDLKDGVLRVPGGGVEKTREIFADDPLRLLRVGRFAGRFGFEPDESTTLAAQAAANTILEVSRERWKTEFDKLLVAESAAQGLDWLARVGVLFFCLPELWALSEIRTGFGCLHVEDTRALDAESQKKDAFQHSVDMMMELPAEPVIRWAGLLHAIGLPAVLQSPGAEGAAGVAEMLAEAIGRRFRFSNDEREDVRFLVLRQGCLRGLEANSRAAVRRLALEAGDLLDPLFALIEVRGAYVAHQTGQHHELEALTDRVQIVRSTLNSLRSEGPLAVQLPSGLGTQLIHKLGIERGPRLGLIIDWLKDEVIEERVPNNASLDTYLAHVKSELEE